MRPWLLALISIFLLSLPASAQSLLPFGSDSPATMSFSENYTDTVFYDTDLQDYDTIPSSTLAFDAKASMKGVDPSTWDDSTSFTVDLNDLSVEFVFGDGTRTTVNGRTTVQWDVIGTDRITLDDVKIGTAFVRWTATDIVFHMEMADDPDDYAIIAPDYAGTVDELDQYPLVLTLTLGDYGIDSRSVYVSGTADLYEKTVGSGDNQQTFTDLAKVKLNGFIDSTKPTVAILNPASHEVITDSPFTMTGTTGDNVAVALVEVQINDGDWLPAEIDGLGHWTLAGVVGLADGNNTVTARATDQDGNIQQTGKRTFKFSSVSPLTVNAAGNASGKVTGPFSPPLAYTPGQPSPTRTSDHKMGEHLVVTATPGPEAVFDGWTSNKLITIQQMGSAELHFSMEPNMWLTAHFLINPFAPVKGAYNGLIGAVDPADRGFFNAKLTPKGTFTATIKIGSLSFVLKGKFSNTGHYVGAVTKGGVTYIIDLTLNVTGTGARVITGTIKGGTIDATVTADLAVFNKHNPAPQAGEYNLLIPPASGNGDANYPFGIGFGHVSVSAKGVAKFVGKLGDGTALTASAPLSAAGGWPFFGALYGKKGVISGNVAFDLADAAHDLSGQADWFKPAGAKPVNVHPEGFGGRSDIAGAKWTKPAKDTRLFLTSTGGVGTFSVDAPANGGDDALASDLAATLSTANKLAVTADATVQNVSAAIDSKTGALSGAFDNAGQTLKFSGLIVPAKLNAAAGMFLRGTRSGAVQIAKP